MFEAGLGPIEFLGAITRIELQIGNGAMLRVASLDVLPDELTARGRIAARLRSGAALTVFRR